MGLETESLEEPEEEDIYSETVFTGSHRVLEHMSSHSCDCMHETCTR